VDNGEVIEELLTRTAARLESLLGVRLK